MPSLAAPNEPFVQPTHRVAEFDVARIEAAATLLTRAFWEDPLFTYVQPHDPPRSRGMTALFSALLKHTLGKGGVLADPRAVLAWCPVGALGGGWLDHVRNGFVAVPWRLGLRATMRLQDHEQWCSARMQALASGDAAYVQLLGVEPNFAGGGLGGQLLADAVATLPSQFRQCVLRTEQPRNVRFYERRGFQCIEHCLVPSSGLPVWFFRAQLR